MNTLISKLEQDDRILEELDNQLRSVSSKGAASASIAAAATSKPIPISSTTESRRRRSSNLLDSSSCSPPPPPLPSSSLQTKPLLSSSIPLISASTTSTKTSNITNIRNKTNNNNNNSNKPIIAAEFAKKSIHHHSLPSLNSNEDDDILNEELKFQDYQSILQTNQQYQQQQHRQSYRTDFENEKNHRRSSITSSSISNELRRIEETLAAVRSGSGFGNIGTTTIVGGGTTSSNIATTSGNLIKSNDHLLHHPHHSHHHNPHSHSHHLHHHHDLVSNTTNTTTNRNRMLTNLSQELENQQDALLSMDKSSIINKPLVTNKTSSTKIDSYLGSEKKSLDIIDKKKISNFSTKDLDLLMEKLDRDNKILAELDKKLKNVVSKTSTSALEESAAGATGQLSSSLPSYTASNLPKTSALAHDHHISKSSNPLNPNNTSSVVPLFNRPSSAITSSRVIPPESYGGQIDDLKEAEEIVDSIELPNRGRCKVFIARFNYDPYKHSPNENPETEVTLLAGDFILVFGNVDDDGYYYGELLDGRRGLVPSNFIEKLTGDDLFEFQARVLYGHHKEAESDTASFPPEFYDAILSEQIGHTSFQHLLAPDDFHRINDYIDLEDATEIDEDVSEPERAEQEAAKTTVPPPQRLIVERQLHKSVLIGWLHPECPRTMIDHYQIYVDGVLKATIPAGDRTKALVEGVDSSMPHRISIRAIDRNGRHSKDPGCTIVIGKNIPFAPCCVKASNITSDSALISWIPCNSNFYHVVAVNSVEVRTVKPSTYKHLIIGLSANTLYRVSVRAKPGKLLCSDEKNPKKLEMLTTFVDFRTLPKSLPDPPVDIQVEAGPQEGTLLVTWLPITLNQFGTSNNCPVTGYAVFAGHKKLAEIDSPTGDHALLDIASLEHLHKKQITVRTKSGENLSQDSMPCQIPDDLLKLPLTNANPNQPLKVRTQIVSDSESETEINRLYNNVARRSKEFDLVFKQQSQIDQTTPYTTQRQQHQQRIMNRQSDQMANRMTAGGRVAAMNQRNVHSSSIPLNDNMTRMNIPAIEITKETPSESVQPMESYSEEEFDQSMKHRVYSGKRSGVSPMPPQRTRVLSEYERSNLGPYNQLSHRRLQNQREHGVRWFVALFDYDPMTMSPNPDAAEEELPFQEGQLIKIYGDKDADGFYRGECNGRIGYVPCNMVSEVQYDVENDPRFRNKPNDPLSHLPIRKMIALYDYDPQELSPNFDTETELAFRTGDIIYVYGDMDEDGFYIGEANGMRGLVPSNFLADAGPVEPSNVRHGKLMSGTQQQQQMLGTQQQQMRQAMNQSSNTMATMGTMAGTQQMMQGGMVTTGTGIQQMVTTATGQMQLQQPGTLQQQQIPPQQQQQYSQTMQQQPFNQPIQSQYNTAQQTGTMFSNTIQQQQTQQPQQQMLMQQQQSQLTGQQPIQQSQLQQYSQTGAQVVSGPNQPQQMFQTQQGIFPQQTQQPLQQQQQLGQQTQNPLQTNQPMSRVMRQQNPTLNVGGHQPQGQFNPVFQGPGTNLGNKQRPNSLDLNTPRFGQQMMNQTGFGGPMQGPQQAGQLQLPNQQQQQQQQAQQQQQSSGMLGSLFASGKKILEEATTPLGARGPFAHPNQPHQPMMGHHQPQPGQQQPQLQPQQQQMPMQQPNQPGQQTQMAFGQPQQPFNPMLANQQNQPGQPAGNLLNTMKNIFKL